MPCRLKKQIVVSEEKAIEGMEFDGGSDGS